MARWCFATLGLAALTGCLEGGQTGQGDDDLLRRVSLFDGTVRVAAPRGYCIEDRSLRRGGQGSFVLMASCESLGGQRGDAVDPAVITVSALPEVDEGDRIGAAQIAESMAPARVLDQVDDGNLSLVRLSEGGDQLLPDGDPVHWRGVTVINGHLMGLAVYGPLDSDMAGARGRTLLESLAQAMREASPVPQDIAEAAADEG